MVTFPQFDEAEDRPVSLHTEITILGAMLLEPVAVDDATAVLRADDFALDSHRRIYQAVLDLREKNYAIDYTTVRAELERRRELDSIGGPGYLAYLTEGVPRNLSIASYVRIVRDRSIARWAIGICDRAMKRFSAKAEEPLHVINETQAELGDISSGAGEETTLEEQSEAEHELMERQRRGEMKTFVPSGLETFDGSHGGFAVGEMTVLGARPRIGKSTLLRQAIIRNCEDDNFVHLFTPEMRTGQVLRCLWASVANVPFYAVRYPEKMSAQQAELLRLAKIAVSRWPLKIDDTSPISATEVIARARRTKRKHNTRLMVVDYLQKLRYSGRSQDRHIEVTDAMVALTSFVKHENMALVLASSITDPGGKEKNRIPTIDDLRQSGDIKFEANTILLLHREIDTETQKLAPETLLIVGKARADEDGSRKVYFDGARQRFVSADEYLRGFGR